MLVKLSPLHRFIQPGKSLPELALPSCLRNLVSFEAFVLQFLPRKPARINCSLPYLAQRDTMYVHAKNSAKAAWKQSNGLQKKKHKPCSEAHSIPSPLFYYPDLWNIQAFQATRINTVASTLCLKSCLSNLFRSSRYQGVLERASQTVHFHLSTVFVSAQSLQPCLPPTVFLGSQLCPLESIVIAIVHQSIERIF